MRIAFGGLGLRTSGSLPLRCLAVVLVGLCAYSTAFPQIINLSSTSNGGQVRTIDEVWVPVVGSQTGDLSNLINPDLNAQFVTINGGARATLIFKFAKPAYLDHLVLTFSNLAAFWNQQPSPPKRIRMRNALGEEQIFTVPDTWTFDNWAVPTNTFQFWFNFQSPTDQLEMEILDVFQDGGGLPFKTLGLSNTTLNKIEIWGSPTPGPPSTLQVRNVAYDPTTRSFSWLANEPMVAALTYYGQTGTDASNRPLYGLKTVRGPNSWGYWQSVALGSDYNTGYVILRMIDPAGNSCQYVPDDLLHNYGLLSMPYRHPTAGITLSDGSLIEDELRREGLGASLQFGYTWIFDTTLPDTNNTLFARMKIEEAQRLGLTPVIMYSWFGFVQLDYFPYWVHDPSDPAVQQQYYAACAQLAQFVASLPNPERVIIGLEPEYNCNYQVAENPAWDDLMVNAIAIIKDGVMPNGTHVTAAPQAKIGIFPDSGGVGQYLIAIPRAAYRMDFIGLCDTDSNAVGGTILGLDHARERITMTAEGIFRKFLKPTIISATMLYDPSASMPELSMTGQAGAVSGFFVPLPFINQSFNTVQLYYPPGTKYLDAWLQARFLSWIGMTYGANGAAYDYALTNSDGSYRPSLAVLKKGNEDLYQQFATSPGPIKPPTTTHTANTMTITASYDTPCQVMVYYGQEDTISSGLVQNQTWSSSRYDQTTDWTSWGQSPQIKIGGLKPGTTYHFRLRAIGHDGVINCSPDYAVTTYSNGDANPAPSSLIRAGDPRGWAYSDLGYLPDASWMSTSYDDSAWKRAVAPFSTVVVANVNGRLTDIYRSRRKSELSYGPNTTNRYVTYYFRGAFNLSQADANRLTASGKPLLSVLARDGYVAYLNGQQVAISDTLKSYSSISYSTPAAWRDDNFNYETKDLTPYRGLLRAGKNVLAIELHTQNINGISYPALFDASLADLGGAQTVIDFGSYWRYDDSNTARDDGAWRQVAFEPQSTSWPAGAGMFGYRMQTLTSSGQSNQAVTNPLAWGIQKVLHQGGNQNGTNKTKTFYFRRSFQTEANMPNNLFLNLRYNDAFVAYLNGIEVGRSPNLPYVGTGTGCAPEGQMPFAQTATWDNLAGTTALENCWTTTTLDLGHAMSTVQPGGWNSLAIELKRVVDGQWSPDDVYLDAQLVENPGVAPVATVDELVAWLLGELPSPPAGADVNGDGKVDIADVITRKNMR